MDDITFKDKDIDILMDQAEAWVNTDSDERGIVVISSGLDKNGDDDNSAVCMGSRDSILKGVLHAINAMPPLEGVIRDALAIVNARKAIKGKPMN